MRNKLTKKSTKQLQEEQDKKINASICTQCKSGIYLPHHEKPHLYKTCPVCGHTKSIK